ncbi:MAG TPA: hypothetical protein VJ723_02265 [Candidatus Angelobacter sp.]|nr:hypothetical protein [Candidatus Angelobacter sp.]
MAEYDIRILTKRQEIDALEKLQEDIFGYGRGSDQVLPYPSRCLFEFAESGGLVAAACERRTQEIVGFSFAWLGRERHPARRLYLHSQLVGVRPDCRDTGVGFQLKLNQRDFAIEHGIDLVKWTFDPLRARNANLNLRKLGATVHLFVENYYGHLGGNFDRSAATDRFWAEWHVLSDRVRSRLTGSDAIIDTSTLRAANRVEGTGDELRLELDLNIQDSLFLAEIPVNIQDLRKDHPEIALKWQDSLRALFAHYLQTYCVIDFAKIGPKCFYVLSRVSPSC